MTQDFIAAAKLLDAHYLCTGKVGVVGFCFGGGMVNQLAVLIPDIIDAGVPFYGRQPNIADVPKIQAPLLIQNAGLDRRILEGAPAFEKALKENGKSFESFVYEDVNHGFHNDSTPRYDQTAAKLAWQRTIAFFNLPSSELAVFHSHGQDVRLVDGLPFTDNRGLNVKMKLSLSRGAVLGSVKESS